MVGVSIHDPFTTWLVVPPKPWGTYNPVGNSQLTANTCLAIEPLGTSLTTERKKTTIQNVTTTPAAVTAWLRDDRNSTTWCPIYNGCTQKESCGTGATRSHPTRDR